MLEILFCFIGVGNQIHFMPHSSVFYDSSGLTV